jgi:hypothetical protein
MGYHDASVVVDPEIARGAVEEGCSAGPGDLEGDPRWADHCACGYRFHLQDCFQVRVERLYKGAPDGKLYLLGDRDLPVGATWDADWLPPTHQGPDGKAWCVRMSGGSGSEWLVYGPSSGGGKWQVTGTAPAFTAHPSINLIGVWHGFLREGVISDDVEGRRYPDQPPVV